MLVPLIFVLILSSLITRAAKKYNTSGATPLLTSIAVFIIFVTVTRGAIQVHPGEMATGIILAILMYATAAAFLYGGVIMWMKNTHHSPKNRHKKYSCFNPKPELIKQEVVIFKKIFVLFLLLIMASLTSSEETGEFIDKRDGQKYPIVKIGDAVWLARNFNYQVKNSWVYDNNKVYEKEYGRLYSWKAAHKACPAGWHLPTDKEWKALEKVVGIPDHQLDKIEYRIPENNNGFEFFKKSFNLVMSGCRKHGTGQFLGMGSFAFFWTSSSYKKIYAWKRGFDKNQKGISRYSFNQKNACAVRYVKDRK